MKNKHSSALRRTGHSSAQHFGGDFGKSETLHAAPDEKQTKPEKGSGPVEDLEHGLWRLWNMSILVAIDPSEYLVCLAANETGIF